MVVTETAIPEVKVIVPQVYEDKRGCFFESFSDEWFRENVCDTTFVQDNESHSIKNTLRGLHYQLPPYAQSKLVRVVKGGVLDVAVDIRVGSPTFGKYVSAILTEDNKKQLFIPRGFAHGFRALSDEVIFQYKVDNPYNKESERNINPFDSTLDIGWLGSYSAVFELSAKDRKAPYMRNIGEEDLFKYEDNLYK